MPANISVVLPRAEKKRSDKFSVHIARPQLYMGGHYVQTYPTIELHFPISHACTMHTLTRIELVAPAVRV